MGPRRPGALLRVIFARRWRRMDLARLIHRVPVGTVGSRGGLRDKADLRGRVVEPVEQVQRRPAGAPPVRGRQVVEEPG
jgi:hypothetical protein